MKGIFINGSKFKSMHLFRWQSSEGSRVVVTIGGVLGKDQVLTAPVPVTIKYKLDRDKILIFEVGASIVRRYWTNATTRVFTNDHLVDCLKKLVSISPEVVGINDVPGNCLIDLGAYSNQTVAAKAATQKLASKVPTKESVLNGVPAAWASKVSTGWG